MSPQMQHGNRRRQMASQAESYLTSSRDLVEEYPMASTVLAFGVGLGVGVLIGQTIVGALTSEPEPSSRLDSLNQQIRDAVRNTVPEVIRQYLPRQFGKA
ncbi:MAG TPA: hypothetical protein VGP63_20320 [Planctomycetaceae bacterium]|jgi:hypothetical protein|nr:hypothetical protein [Planctomycetaceae bacterium]